MISARRVLVTAMTWSHTGRVTSRNSKRWEALEKEEAVVEVEGDHVDVAVAVVQW